MTWSPPRLLTDSDRRGVHRSVNSRALSTGVGGLRLGGRGAPTAGGIRAVTTGLDVPVLTGMWIGNSSDADTGEHRGRNIRRGIPAPLGGDRSGLPGDPPPGGAPGGPGGCTFWRVFNNSPSRDKMDFRFFRVFRDKMGQPPHTPRYTPPDTPPDTPLWDPPFPVSIYSKRTPKTPPKRPQNRPSQRTPRNPLRRPRRGPRAPGAPGRPGRAPGPPGGPRGAPGGPPRGAGFSAPRNPPPTGGDITGFGWQLARTIRIADNCEATMEGSMRPSEVDEKL